MKEHYIFSIKDFLVAKGIHLDSRALKNLEKRSVA